MTPAAFCDTRFCSAVFDCLQQERLLAGVTHAVLAVSGGLDSMVLLDFFRRFGAKKYGLQLTIAHLDHGLRPESAADACWLHDFCQTARLAFYSERVEVRQQQALSAQSSLEAVARELRYDWLGSLASQCGAHAVLTAHTASDQLETVLMRWIRGSISGLQGMAPRRPLSEGSPVQLLRPLLGLTRPQLAAYASAHRLSWREDASNQDPAFFRNRLRQDLIPLLLAENPRLAEQVSLQSEIWRAEQDWLRAQAQAHFAQLVQHSPEGLRLPVKPLLALPLALQRCLLREVLTQQGEWKRYSTRHLEDLRALAAGPGQKELHLPGGRCVRKSSQHLLFLDTDAG
ncbi:MAG: tRNA lysidine(34) synthetase TilS [Candidatus Sericytochromatia bacterium]|nr:tRNA lysidine(34) synthetase TilS [Candidatus Sericytochromatia bacterium]